jgi:hypothetical protein
MWNFLLGMLVGAPIGWIVRSFVGEPLVNFWSLRTAVARDFARYEDSFDHNPDADPPSADWLLERKKAYETTGAALVAFGVSNSHLAGYIQRAPITSLRCYPRSAGSNLLTLAGTRPGTQASEQLRAQVVSALKLKYWPSHVKRRVAS